jgi:trans-aconitate 2-methyltransferase
MNPSHKDVADYYNKVWAGIEEKTSNKPNTRHFLIFKNLKRAGLKINSKVLEIGCGSASLTHMVAKFVTEGKIVGTDISNETIELNRRKYASFKNMEFHVSNMTDFMSSETFDFVVIPDVLEHIPKEEHENIFKTILKVTHENSTLLINNPEPNLLSWYHKTKPGILQIIDQPLHLNYLANLIYSHGFFIESVTPFAISLDVAEYQSIVCRRNTTFDKMKQNAKVKQAWVDAKSRL